MPEYISSVSPKGQVTLPIEIRKRLRIKPKDRVIFTLEGESVRIMPASSRLAEGFSSVPALEPSLTPEKVEEMAGDEIARNAAGEGL